MSTHPTPEEDRLLTEPEAAARLEVAAGTLKDWRSRRRPNRPAHVKFNGCVRYRKRDLDAFIEKNVKAAA